MPAIRLNEAPYLYNKAAASMMSSLDQPADRPVWRAKVNARPALAAVDDQALLVACPGNGRHEGRIRWASIEEIKRVGTAIMFQIVGKAPLRLELDSAEDAQAFESDCSRAREDLPESARGSGAALADVLLVTSNDIPGCQIVAVHGEVFGAIVRARNMFSNIGASLRTAVGGEVGGYTQLVTQSRNEARERLAEAALAKGGNAVIAMRYDSNEMADVMTEIVAYGTAVTIVRP